MISPADLRVCLPAYNEAEALPSVVAELRAAGLTNIWVINDGSTDATQEVLNRLGIPFLSHPINRGAGAAVQTAIELARKRQWPAVLFLDADGQHLATDGLAVLDRLNSSGADLILGSRFLSPNPGMPHTRKVFNRIANGLTNFLCRGMYTDSQSGLRLLNARAINRLSLEVDGFGFCSEMLIKAKRAGLRTEEVSISVRYTDYSLSKGQNLQVGIDTAVQLVWNVLFR